MVRDNPLHVNTTDVIHMLLERKYELLDGSNFLAEIELSIGEYRDHGLRDFYVYYLPEFLADDSPLRLLLSREKPVLLIKKLSCSACHLLNDLSRVGLLKTNHSILLSSEPTA